YTDHWLWWAARNARVRRIGLIVIGVFAIVCAILGAIYLSEWSEYRHEIENTIKAQQVQSSIVRELESLRDGRGKIRQELANVGVASDRRFFDFSDELGLPGESPAKRDERLQRWRLLPHRAQNMFDAAERHERLLAKYFYLPSWAANKQPIDF